MAVAITQTANPAGVNTSSNVATYSSVAIGDASANRIVVVLVGSELASASIDSVTLGGNAMSAGTQGNFGAVYARAFYLAYPTGTTADVVVTYGAGATSTQNHIAVYSVTGGVYSSTGADQSSDMDTTDRLTTGAITIASGGGFIAIAAGATDTVAKAWAEATEDLDVDAGGFRFTTATRTTALTATAVTCTGGTNGEDGALSYLLFTANVSPTVALNSPADTATITDTTPELIFTGTDTESNDIRYNVQVDTVNTFDTGPNIDAPYIVTESVIDTEGSDVTNGTASLSFPTGIPSPGLLIHISGYNNDIGESGYRVISSVTYGGDAMASLVNQDEEGSIYMRDYFFFLANPSTGSNTLSITWAGEIEDYGVLFIPLGNVSSTQADATAGEVDTSTNAPSINITTTEANCLVIGAATLNAAPGNMGGGTNVTEISPSDYNVGGYSIVGSRGVVSSASTVAVAFTDTQTTNYVLTAVSIAPAPGPLINAVSGTDAGFLDSPDESDTDPFTSGTAVAYTVQSALDLDTYYWRVRGLDPSGSNTYGAWATTRSFTIEEGSSRRRIILTS